MRFYNRESTRAQSKNFILKKYCILFGVFKNII